MEHEAFLGREGRASDVSTTRDDDDAPEAELDHTLSTRVFWYCLALMFLLRLTITAVELPLLRLVEQVICKAYLGTDIDGIDEKACKIPAVQDKVAKIMGYRSTFDALPCTDDMIQTYLIYLSNCCSAQVS